MKIARNITLTLAGTSLVMSMAGAAVAGGESSDDLLMSLKKLVEQQQERLDKQAGEIAQLKEQLTAVTIKTDAKVDKEEFNTIGVDKMVSSSNKNVNVSLYGHVNRAALWADNGNSSKVYFVDNMNSSTRMGLTARAKTPEDLSIGARIEYQLVSNASTDVNQLEQDTGATFDLRWADVDFKNNTFGTIFLGHGSTASDGTAEVDLSGTSVAAYSPVEYPAGGQLWYDSQSNMLTSLQVKNVFNNMDGLSRRDRLRYDSHSFAGFTVAGSAIEQGAFDAALKYSRKLDAVTLAAALAWASPQDIMPTVENQYDGSFSLLLNNGLNFTLAGGRRDMKEDGRDDSGFWYTKIGYKASLFSPGVTAFSLDYGQSNDIAANDDEAKTFGAAFVQDIKDWGTEIYLIYRFYQLDRVYYDFNNINAVITGARIKF